jgi:hypothetical protein
MKSVLNLLLGIIILASAASAQSVPSTTTKPFYLETFRKGPSHIAESSIVANLTTEKRTFETNLKDGSGDSRFVLSSVPQTVDDVDPTIIVWRVRLMDSHRKYLGNLLVATSPGNDLTDQPGDRAWLLSPTPYAAIPLLTPRIFKIESFYCVVQVKDYRLVTPERFALDSMRVEVQFTNTNPINN